MPDENTRRHSWPFAVRRVGVLTVIFFVSYVLSAFVILWAHNRVDLPQPIRIVTAVYSIPLGLLIEVLGLTEEVTDFTIWLMRVLP